MNPLRKFILAALGAALLIPVVAAGIVFNLGPRMRHQPNIRAYEAVMPPMPEGSVPSFGLQDIHGKSAADRLVIPIAADEINVKAGETAYGYWCVACHGILGRGRGPVGESYVPLPPKLNTERVRRMGDGELLRAMLLGTGHEPVLERVIPVERRWQVLLYVRSLPEPVPKRSQDGFSGKSP